MSQLDSHRHLAWHHLSPAKARAIAIPVDLDSQVNTLSLKVHSNMVQRAAKDWRISARTRPRKEPLGGPDYKNIIEKLQVLFLFLFLLILVLLENWWNKPIWLVEVFRVEHHAGHLV